LMNTQAIQTKISHEAGLPARLIAQCSESTDLLESLYLTVFSRRPTSQELERLLPLFSAQGAVRQTTVENLLWAMLNSPEYIYED
jgi:hypothetical protein